MQKKEEEELEGAEGAESGPAWFLYLMCPHRTGRWPVSVKPFTGPASLWVPMQTQTYTFFNF